MPVPLGCQPNWNAIPVDISAPGVNSPRGMKAASPSPWKRVCLAFFLRETCDTIPSKGYPAGSEKAAWQSRSFIYIWLSEQIRQAAFQLLIMSRTCDRHTERARSVPRNTHSGSDGAG